MAHTTFEGRIIFNSGAAIRFQGQFWEAPLWLPRSQIEIEPDGEDTVVVRVKDWLANKNRLQEFTYYDAEAIEERDFKE